MKNVIFLVAISAILAACHKPESASNPQLKPLRTWDEVLAKAEKYGLADTFRFKNVTENGLMYFTDKGLEKHFAEEKKYYEQHGQSQRYRNEAKEIRSLNDYFRLLDSLPLYRIRIYGTEEKYEALKKEYLASNYLFFINEETRPPFSVPYLIPVSKPEEMPTRKARSISNR